MTSSYGKSRDRWLCPLAIAFYNNQPMRYFLDCEFIEDGVTIDLISIGIVAEDGRELYCVSSEFDYQKASQWVKDNVLAPMGIDRPLEDINPPFHPHPLIKQTLQDSHDIPAIKKLILDFCDIEKYGTPEIWGEWSSYDWVAFCQIFGTMMDLPQGFPMRCRDVIQYAEDHLGIPASDLPPSLETEGNHNALLGARTVKDRYQYLNKIRFGE